MGCGESKDRKIEDVQQRLARLEARGETRSRELSASHLHNTPSKREEQLERQLRKMEARIKEMEERTAAESQLSHSSDKTRTPVREARYPDQPSPNRKPLPPYQGPGPAVIGRTDALFAEGLAYKVVEDLGEGKEQWYMYNDTADSILQVEYFFGPQSIIMPVGEGKADGFSQDGHWAKLVAAIPPLKTCAFMRGTVNGYRGDGVLETLPVHYPSSARHSVGFSPLGSSRYASPPSAAPHGSSSLATFRPIHQSTSTSVQHYPVSSTSAAF